jgi:hypothetical protein
MNPAMTEHERQTLARVAEAMDRGGESDRIPLRPIQIPSLAKPAGLQQPLHRQPLRLPAAGTGVQPTDGQPTTEQLAESYFAAP